MRPHFKSPCVDHGKEAITDLAFHGSGELDGDDLAGKGFVEQSPESFAHAGGIYDEIPRLPLFGKVFELTKDGEVILTRPGEAVDDAVGGVLEGFNGGQVDLGDGEGGGVTGRVGEAVGGISHYGFVLTGEVEEESDPPPAPG